jgi:integrase
MTWAERPLDTFTGEDLLRVRRELVRAKRGPDTLNHFRRVVRGVFGTHPSSPAMAWPWCGRKDANSEGKLRFYNPAQVRRLLAEAHSPMDRAIFTLATEAGPRQSEIRALKVGNVDFEVGVVRFEDGYTTHGGHAANKGRRVRAVPMSANVRETLAPFCAGKRAHELVFQHESNPGDPICGISLYRRFRSAAERAGLPRIAFHDLRHSFGTQAIRAFNIYEVQRMMGHRHITTTERYLHYAPDPDAAAKLTSLWRVEPDLEERPKRRSPRSGVGRKRRLERKVGQRRRRRPGTRRQSGAGR